jgi:hypothetical protein
LAAKQAMRGRVAPGQSLVRYNDEASHESLLVGVRRHPSGVFAFVRVNRRRRNIDLHMREII